MRTVLAILLVAASACSGQAYSEAVAAKHVVDHLGALQSGSRELSMRPSLRGFRWLAHSNLLDDVIQIMEGVNSYLNSAQRDLRKLLTVTNRGPENVVGVTVGNTPGTVSRTGSGTLVLAFAQVASTPGQPTLAATNDRIARLLKLAQDPLPYLYESSGPWDDISIVARDLPVRVLGFTDYREMYDQLYFAAVQYNRLVIKSIHYASQAARRGDLNSASRFLDHATRLIQQQLSSYAAAQAVGNKDLARATTYVEFTYKTSKWLAGITATAAGLPGGSSMVDAAGLFIELAVNANDAGIKSASKQFLVDATIGAIIKLVPIPGLDGRTLDKALTNRAGKILADYGVIGGIQTSLKDPAVRKLVVDGAKSLLALPAGNNAAEGISSILDIILASNEADFAPTVSGSSGQPTNRPMATPDLQQSMAAQDCSLESSLKSTAFDTPSTIEFVNNGTQSVSTFWIGYAGQRVLYKSLAPGQSYVQQTFISHPWMVADASKQCLGIYVPTAGDTRVVIGGTVAPNFANMKGGWGGIVHQGGLQYPVAMELQVNGTNQVTGTVSYPSLSCTGRLDWQGPGSGGVALREVIASGRCVQGGLIRINMNSPGTLDWRWYYPDGREGATAKLTRTTVIGTGVPNASSGPAIRAGAAGMGRSGSQLLARLGSLQGTARYAAFAEAFGAGQVPTPLGVAEAIAIGSGMGDSQYAYVRLVASRLGSTVTPAQFNGLAGTTAGLDRLKVLAAIEDGVGIAGNLDAAGFNLIVSRMPNYRVASITALAKKLHANLGPREVIEILGDSSSLMKLPALEEIKKARRIRSPLSEAEIIAISAGFGLLEGQARQILMGP
jgi:hypothetical protein